MGLSRTRQWWSRRHAGSTLARRAHGRRRGTRRTVGARELLTGLEDHEEDRAVEELVLGLEAVDPAELVHPRLALDGSLHLVARLAHGVVVVLGADASDAAQSALGLLGPTLAEEPARRLGREEDADHEDEGPECRKAADDAPRGAAVVEVARADLSSKKRQRRLSSRRDGDELKGTHRDAVGDEDAGRDSELVGRDEAGGRARRGSQLKLEEATSRSRSGLEMSLNLRSSDLLGSSLGLVEGNDGGKSADAEAGNDATLREREKQRQLRSQGKKVAVVQTHDHELVLLRRGRWTSAGCRPILTERGGVRGARGRTQAVKDAHWMTMPTQRTMLSTTIAFLRPSRSASLQSVRRNEYSS